MIYSKPTETISCGVCDDDCECCGSYRIRVRDAQRLLVHAIRHGTSELACDDCADVEAFLMIRDVSRG